MDQDLAPLDALDHALIAALRTDGRVPNRTLAERLGVGEGTVGVRIRRLADDRVVRVVAVTDMAAMGYPILVSAWIETSGASPVAVGHLLADIEEIPAVVLLLGPYDLFATVLARDHDHLAELALQIQSVPGVARIDWDLALEVFAYRSQWGVLSEDGHPPMPAPGPGIDELDVALIGRLQHDGRASNRKLAVELGVSEATVRARIRRLESMDAIRIIAVTDVARFGMTGFAVVGIRVEAGTSRQVASALTGLPGVEFAATTLGPHEVLASVVVENQTELLRLVLDDIAAIPGVTRTATAEGQMVLKHSFSWVRLTEPPAVKDAMTAQAVRRGVGRKRTGSDASPVTK
jgi:DNA-binding Lrp family transcriptional regulator